jgi:hypothetical protein
MKRLDSYMVNTTTPAGRAEGAAKNNPGDNSGSGMDKESVNDPSYAIIAVINSYKEDGLSDTDETTVASDARDAIEEMTERKVDSVAEWDNSTIFGIGDLVTDMGYQFVSFKAANQNNIPIATIATQWHKLPKSDALLDLFASGSIKSDLAPFSDRASGDYAQNIAYGTYRMGVAGNDFKNFFRVHLDGATITGDATLEAIFKPGLAGEYWNIDIIAPDIMGTRIIIDMGGRTTRSQSSSGKADTIGELQEDAMQRITGSTDPSRLSIGSGNIYGAFTGGSASTSISAVELGDGVAINFDNANSTSPNAAKTDDEETRMANIVTGAAYIIVMVAA